MQKKILYIGFVFMMTSKLQLNAQNVEDLQVVKDSQEAQITRGIQQDRTYRKWYIGSSLYLLGNLDKKNNPEYVQLNIGYRITPKNVVSFEFKRSIYSFPIGIPFGSSSFDGDGENYPGHARILAPTLGYQHFWWKGVYTSVYALNAFEKYFDEDNEKIGNGYTLYLNFHFGYQFMFFKNRFFFEPAIGCSYWPIRNNVPESFKEKDKKWPNYFIQPGFHFGYNFDFKKKK
jgi:hypothetical protein